MSWKIQNSVLNQKREGLCFHSCSHTNLSRTLNTLQQHTKLRSHTQLNVLSDNIQYIYISSFLETLFLLNLRKWVFHNKAFTWPMFVRCFCTAGASAESTVWDAALPFSSCTGAGRAAWSGRNVSLPGRIAAWSGSACGGSLGSAPSALPGPWPSGRPAAGRRRAGGSPRQPDAKICAASRQLAWTRHRGKVTVDADEMLEDTVCSVLFWCKARCSVGFVLVSEVSFRPQPCSEGNLSGSVICSLKTCCYWCLITWKLGGVRKGRLPYFTHCPFNGVDVRGCCANVDLTIFRILFFFSHWSVCDSSFGVHHLEQLCLSRSEM